MIKKKKYARKSVKINLTICALSSLIAPPTPSHDRGPRVHTMNRAHGVCAENGKNGRHSAPPTPSPSHSWPDNNETISLPLVHAMPSGPRVGVAFVRRAAGTVSTRRPFRTPVVVVRSVVP